MYVGLLLKIACTGSVLTSGLYFKGSSVCCVATGAVFCALLSANIGLLAVGLGLFKLLAISDLSKVAFLLASTDLLTSISLGIDNSSCLIFGLPSTAFTSSIDIVITGSIRDSILTATSLRSLNKFSNLVPTLIYISIKDRNPGLSLLLLPDSIVCVFSTFNKKLYSIVNNLTSFGLNVTPNTCSSFSCFNKCSNTVTLIVANLLNLVPSLFIPPFLRYILTDVLPLLLLALHNLLQLAITLSSIIFLIPGLLASFILPKNLLRLRVVLVCNALFSAKCNSSSPTTSNINAILVSITSLVLDNDSLSFLITSSLSGLYNILLTTIPSSGSSMNNVLIFSSVGNTNGLPSVVIGILFSLSPP